MEASAATAKATAAAKTSAARAPAAVEAAKAALRGPGRTGRPWAGPAKAPKPTGPMAGRGRRRGPVGSGAAVHHAAQEHALPEAAPTAAATASAATAADAPQHRENYHNNHNYNDHPHQSANNLHRPAQQGRAPVGTLFIEVLIGVLRRGAA